MSLHAMPVSTAAQPSVPDLMQVLLDSEHLVSAERTRRGSWKVRRSHSAPEIALSNEIEALDFVIDTLLNYHAASGGMDAALSE